MRHVESIKVIPLALMQTRAEREYGYRRESKDICRENSVEAHRQRVEREEPEKDRIARERRRGAQVDGRRAARSSAVAAGNWGGTRKTAIVATVIAMLEGANGKRVTIDDLAAIAGVSDRYLADAISLDRAAFAQVRMRQGRGGGYWIAKGEA